MRAREWPALEPLLFGGVLVIYAAGLPIGLERPGTGLAAAEGVGLEGAVAPLALLAIRALGYLPVGDLATRANLASALAGAAAAALLGRLACETLRAMRPAPAARQPGSPIEPVAAGGAAGVAALSLGAFRAGTAAGSTAITVALMAAAWTSLLVLLRHPEETRAGLRLALLAGLAAGVEPVAAPLVWLPAAWCWFRALRRGSRWPLVAPTLFTAGLGLALLVVAVTEAPPTLGQLLAGLWPAGPSGTFSAWLGAVAAPAREAGEQLGVVGFLLAALGLLVMLRRATGTALFLLASMVGGLWLVGGVRLAAAALAIPIPAGITHLADKLGQARLAAAAALAVMAAVSPALDGGARRWSRDARLPAHLLGRALSDAPLRATVDPGTPEMTALFHYARSVGLRPDLTVSR